MGKNMKYEDTLHRILKFLIIALYQANEGDIEVSEKT